MLPGVKHYSHSPVENPVILIALGLRVLRSRETGSGGEAEPSKYSERRSDCRIATI